MSQVLLEQREAEDEISVDESLILDDEDNDSYSDRALKDSMNWWLGVVRRRAVLGAEDEERNRLALTHLPFAVSEAKSYSGRGVPLPDLIQEANIGLLLGAEKFDPELGNKFITYAWHWVGKRLTAAVREQGFTTSLSLCQPLGEDEDGECIGDAMADPKATDPNNDALQSDLTEAISEALDVLSPRQRETIIWRFGLDGRGIRTLAEIAHIQKVKLKSVSQAQQRALRKLRKSRKNHRLRAWVS